MASMVALFSTLGENIPIFKREKILQAYSEGYINRLHYRATCLLIMAMTVMVTCPEWISGEGTYIGNADNKFSSELSPPQFGTLACPQNLHQCQLAYYISSIDLLNCPSTCGETLIIN